MRIAGVICECNPPHAGHLYLLERARQDGAELVICVMSGCFVQRGEAAVADAYARAEILVRSGADVVVELPMPYAASSAEFFGGAGVDILCRLGITELWFGSETGDLSSLEVLSVLAESEAFVNRDRARCTEGMGTAQAYFETLSELSGGRSPLSPNDILALSYLRALRRHGGHACPRAIRRLGSGYREGTITQDAYPSATALRLVWECEGVEAMAAHLPAVAAEVIEKEARAGRAPARLDLAERWILGSLRLADERALSALAGLGGGLAGRLVKAARRATDLAELMALCATKAYPDATVRRAILYALLGVKGEDLLVPVSYVRLLAANKAGCEHLASVRRTDAIRVVTRRGDLPDDSAAMRQRELEERTLRLYTMMMPHGGTEERLLCQKPLIF